jgi:hypothetical protein
MHKRAPRGGLPQAESGGRRKEGGVTGSGVQIGSKDSKKESAVMAKAGSGALHASRSRRFNSYLALSNEMHQAGRQRKSTRCSRG